MNKICTDISQSEKLIELGLDINTSDMVCLLDVTMGNGKHRILPKDDFAATDGINMPSWSLTALLELMPEYYDGYSLEMRKIDSRYCCVYSDFHGGDYHWYYADSPLDAAFEMVSYLLKEKVI